MKIHITNLYNFNSGDELVKKQHRFAEAGRSLGFLEMGIFSYPVETDTPGELSKRLDGIIAALEPGDLVFVQLPTENGPEYEQLLLRKIKAYGDTKVVLVLQDMQFFTDIIGKELQYKYADILKSADAVISSANYAERVLKVYGVSDVLCFDDVQVPRNDSLDEAVGYVKLYQSDFYVKKVLMDAIENVFSYQKEMMRSVFASLDEEIHIGFGLHDKTGNYSMLVGVAMQSIIENTDASIRFHIMHDETLSVQNRNRLLQIAQVGRKKISFHMLDKSIFADITEQVEKYTIGTMFRIMLPELLPELSRIIYLDADLLVNRNIKDLWNTDIQNYYIAAVPDMEVVRGVVKPIPVQRKIVDAKSYFNAGVLYMNLDMIREKGNMRIEVLEYLEKKKESDFPDQNAINVIYKDKVLLLDGGWNYFSVVVHSNNEKELKKVIYHYAGDYFKLHSTMDMDYLYYEIISHTPWGEVECRNKLRKTIERINDRNLQLAKLIEQSNLVDAKHIFYGAETYAMRNMYRLLTIKERDYRVLVNPDAEKDGILKCKDFTCLVDEKEPYIVFVLPEADNWSSISRLEQLGLENGKNFFVIPRLLTPEKGGYV